MSFLPSNLTTTSPAATATTSSSSSSSDTVGSLLAAIATALQDGLRILMFADKRGWGPDEFEQVRALEEALDEAKKDFQELSPLVNGQFYYEEDRRAESLNELRALRAKFETHAQNFKDWLRAGGPINPVWARETGVLRRELHRAQRRAARRIFNAEQEGSARCLGAFLVYRRLRENQERARREREARALLPPWRVRQQEEEERRREQERELQQLQLQQQQREQGRWGEQDRYGSLGGGGESVPRGFRGGSREQLVIDTGYHPHVRKRLSLEDLVPDCNAVGTFERFGDRDIAFVCDFCDGHIVWEDVRRMPNRRAAATVTATEAEEPGSSSSSEAVAYPNWQATATAALSGEEKTIVFAPLAIANHMAPMGGGWEARLWCPFCDEYTYHDTGGEDQARYAQDEAGFPDLRAFQEHLEWYHTAVPMPALPVPTGTCAVM